MPACPRECVHDYARQVASALALTTSRVCSPDEKSAPTHRHRCAFACQMIGPAHAARSPSARACQMISAPAQKDPLATARACLTIGKGAHARTHSSQQRPLKRTHAQMHTCPVPNSPAHTFLPDDKHVRAIDRTHHSTCTLPHDKPARKKAFASAHLPAKSQAHLLKATHSRLHKGPKRTFGRALIVATARRGEHPRAHHSLLPCLLNEKRPRSREHAPLHK